MLSFEQASELIFENCPAPQATPISIDQAAGYVLAEDIVSPISVAPFRNSAMDGFAIRAEWLKDCSEDRPIRLPYTNTLYAGDFPTGSIPERQACKVMTGAMVPDQFDSVIRFEDCTYDEEQVTFTMPVTSRRNIRSPGEDITEGQKLFSEGGRLTKLDIGVLAVAGIATISIYRKPRLLIVCTGDELVPLGQPLGPGQVYNSNQYTIESMISGFASAVSSVPTAADELEQLAKQLDGDFDMIITSGGVSAGEKDLVIPAANSMGWTSVFHKVRIKPGKPVFLGKRNNQLLLGLPGNPLSTAVTCAIFAIPVLKKMAGRKDYALSPRPAELDPDSIRKSGRMLIWPGSFQTHDGRTLARFADKKSSAAISALLGSDGLLFQSLDNPSSPEISVVPWTQILD